VYIRRFVRFVNAVEKPAMPKLEYPVIIAPLPQDGGGGFVALVPDLPGCVSDGETAQAALASVMDTVDAPPSRHLVAAE
jgi:hypothetical protein